MQPELFGEPVRLVTDTLCRLEVCATADWEVCATLKGDECHSNSVAVGPGQDMGVSAYL